MIVSRADLAIDGSIIETLIPDDSTSSLIYVIYVQVRHPERKAIETYQFFDLESADRHHSRLLSDMDHSYTGSNTPDKLARFHHIGEE